MSESEKHPTLYSIGISKPTACADVVFIHGLGGHYQETWNYSHGPGLYWPEELSRDLEDVNVWALNYPSAIIKLQLEGGDMNMYQRALSITHALYLESLGKRPLIFIVHSLGGLLIKQILRICAEFNYPDYKPIAEKTVGVVFIASPHSGAGITKLAKIPNFLSLTTKIVQELIKESSHLESDTQWFQNHAQTHDIQVRVFYETRPIPAGFIVIDKEEASLVVGKGLSLPIDADHFSICRPNTKKHPVYRDVRKFLVEKCLSSENMVPNNKNFSLQTTDISKLQEVRVMFQTTDISPKKILDAKRKIELILANGNWGLRTFEIKKWKDELMDVIDSFENAKEEKIKERIRSNVENRLARFIEQVTSRG